MLTTASGDQYGSWNALRPFAVDLPTGNVSIGNSRLNVLHGGNVGIGTATPSALLHVNGSLTATSGSERLNYYYMIASPGAASTATYYGSNGSAAKFNNGNLAGAALVGSTGVAEQGGTGTLGTATGLEGFVTKYGSGNITTANGVTARLQSTTSGTVSDYNGVLVETNITSGVLTNAYGLRISDLQATNGYGIYQVGADDANYFAGNVGIGSVPGSSKLHVNGRITASVGSDADALSALTVDFSSSNMVRATAAAGACGTLNFTNVAAGGSYTVTIPNATATCTAIQMSGSTTNVKLPSGYGAGGEAVSGVVYTAIYDGTTLWVSYVPF